MVVVSLNEVDASYKTYGDGQIIVIDPATDTVVASVARSGCSTAKGWTLSRPAGRRRACGGTYGEAGEYHVEIAFVVDLGASPPSVTTMITGMAFGNQPVNFSWVLAAPPAAGGTRAFAGTNDPNLIAPDVLFSFDYLLGTTTQVTTSSPYSIGPSAATTSLLFVPEFLGSTPGQLFDMQEPPQAPTALPNTVVASSPVEQLVLSAPARRAVTAERGRRLALAVYMLAALAAAVLAGRRVRASLVGVGALGDGRVDVPPGGAFPRVLHGPAGESWTLSRPPRRIVSTYLAADEILAALVSPGRLAAVSTFADDPAISALARLSRALPRVRLQGGGESWRSSRI